MNTGNGATKIEPKKQNDNVISKGLDEGKLAKMDLEREDRRKTKKRKGTLFEKGLAGGERNKTSFLDCRTQFCVSQIVWRVKKTPELQGKRRYLSYSESETPDTRKRKGKPTKT